MKRSEAILSEEGRITLPAAVRAALRVKPGDRLILDQHDAGDIHVHARAETLADRGPRIGDLSRLPGIIQTTETAGGDPVSDDPVGDYLVAEDERTRSGR